MGNQQNSAILDALQTHCYMERCNLGVRQGGPESPMLHNLFMDFVLRVFFHKCSEKRIQFLNLKYKIPASASLDHLRDNVGFHDVKWVGYADDLVLMFENAQNLDAALNLLNDTFGAYGLTINTTKTKTMVLNFLGAEDDYPTIVASLNNGSIDNVKIFKYLGCNLKFDEATTGDSELELRIDAAQAKFYELGKKIFNYRIQLLTRITIFNALVRSRLTFSCQTWTATNEQINRINAVYMSMIRSMVRGGHRRRSGTFHYVLTNKELLRICKTEDIHHQFVARQQRNFVAHIIRSSNERLLKRLLFNSNDARQPGRRTTLYKTVLTNERTNEDDFHRNALARMY